MKMLCDRIRAEGQILPGNVLKVDSFLNHQIDVDLYAEMGKKFYEAYKDCGVNKILTIEASGIGIACITAQSFHVPVVFAKKARSANIPDGVYTCRVHSFTHGRDYDITVAKRFLGPDDRLLIIDDFLANGCALRGLTDICEQAGATVVGAGIAIEKGFQTGGAEMRAKGLRIESLAVIESMSEDGTIVFANDQD
jgi:xanthine phosphoribosyltransferase